MIATKLFIVAKPVKKPKARIFCFPYAGGSAHSYFSWKERFPDDIELVLVQPPGRGKRILEKPHQSMLQYVNELLEFQDYLTGIPYILFGHSLGARVAYELANQLNLKEAPLPMSLVVSGSPAPHKRRCETPTFDLPDDEFIDEVLRLNGTPTEVTQNYELMSLILPLLRADFKIAETYIAEKNIIPLPIVVFSGESDPFVKLDDIRAWQELTDYEVETNMLPGDHFFINEHTQFLTGRISALTQNT